MFDFYEEYQSDSIKARLEANQKRIDAAKPKVQSKPDPQPELGNKSKVIIVDEQMILDIMGRDNVSRGKAVAIVREEYNKAKKLYDYKPKKIVPDYWPPGIPFDEDNFPHVPSKPVSYAEVAPKKEITEEQKRARWEKKKTTLGLGNVKGRRRRVTQEQESTSTPVVSTPVKGDACKRCGSTGYLPEYSYYAEGKCFTCDGTGVVK